MRIQQLEPVPEIVLEAYRSDEDPVPEGQSEVSWDSLGERQFPTENDPVGIEPGESDQILYDFHVPGDVRTVQVYTHYPNRRTKGESGWQLTTVHDIS